MQEIWFATARTVDTLYLSHDFELHPFLEDSTTCTLAIMDEFIDRQPESVVRVEILGPMLLW